MNRCQFIIGCTIRDESMGEISQRKNIEIREFTSVESIKRKIFLIRGEKVMIDRDLAELYQVETKALNQAVNRNKDRFPSEFMFRLTKEEMVELVTNCDRLKTLRHSFGRTGRFRRLSK